jgi:hypothetical protein
MRAHLPYHIPHMHSITRQRESKKRVTETEESANSHSRTQISSLFFILLKFQNLLSEGSTGGITSRAPVKFFGYPYCWSQFLLNNNTDFPRGTQWYWPENSGGGAHLANPQTYAFFFCLFFLATKFWAHHLRPVA